MGMSLKMMPAIAATIILGAVASVTALAAPAQATGWNCHTGFSSTGIAYGTCNSSDSHGYRLWALCALPFDAGAYDQYGPSVTSGASKIYGACGWPYHVKGLYIIGGNL